MQTFVGGSIMNEKKSKKFNKKKALKITGIVLAVIVVLVCINMIANTITNSNNTKFATSFEKVQIKDQLIPKKDADGNWTFTTDRELKVLHFTDIHIGGGWLSAKQDKMALNAVAAMITAEKPDLVVVTGDLVYPVPYESMAINNLPPHKVFASLMETLGIYWIPTFGNHDTEFYSFYSREEISEYYSTANFKYCLYQEGDENIDGCGNSVINVKNSDGIITQSIFAIDSNAYVGTGLIDIIKMEYDNIHENQVEWYKTTVEKNNEYNKNIIANMENKDELMEKYGKLNTLLFFHIPIAEYREAWAEYSQNGYKDTENVKLVYGTASESGRIIYNSDIPDNLFETMQELGGTHGTFCGHDHINNFSIDYKGIRLTYGLSIDYLAYSGISKLGSQRGCTVITVKPDGSFDCVQENYYQDKYATDMREEVTMQELIPSKIEE